MTEKEFVLQFCIQNGLGIENVNRVIDRACHFVFELKDIYPQAFDNDDEQDRLTNAIEIALDHAQRDGGFAVQLKEKQ